MLQNGENGRIKTAIKPKIYIYDICHYKNSLYFLQTFPTKIGFGVKQYHFLNNSEGRNFQCTFPTSSLVGNAFWPLNMLTWNPRNGSYKFICRKRFILKKEKENSNGHVGAQSSRHISYKYTRRNGFFFKKKNCNCNGDIRHQCCNCASPNIINIAAILLSFLSFFEFHYCCKKSPSFFELIFPSPLSFNLIFSSLNFISIHHFLILQSDYYKVSFVNLFYFLYIYICYYTMLYIIFS
jgi:hypothetical protein